MCKLFLISLILTLSLSLSFSTNDSNCEEKKDSYELQLKKDDFDVVKFAEDGWNKLVAEERTRVANSRGNLYVNCVRVQVIDTERKYTMLLNYETDLPNAILYCVIFVWTNQRVSLTTSCWKFDTEFNMPQSNLELYDVYYFFDESKLFCPKD